MDGRNKSHSHAARRALLFHIPLWLQFSSGGGAGQSHLLLLFILSLPPPSPYLFNVDVPKHAASTCGVMWIFDVSSVQSESALNNMGGVEWGGWAHRV